MLAYTALVFVYGVFVSVASLILEELELKRFPRPLDLAILTLAAVAENFGYRQINNFWRVKGYWQYLGRNDPNRLFEARLIAVISWDRKPSLKP